MTYKTKTNCFGVMMVYDAFPNFKGKEMAVHGGKEKNSCTFAPVIKDSNIVDKQDLRTSQEETTVAAKVVPLALLYASQEDSGGLQQ